MDGEDGSTARACQQLDPAARLADDPVDGREPEPRSLPRRLRREEGLEGPRQRLAVHPVTRVGDAELPVGGNEQVGAGEAINNTKLQPNKTLTLMLSNPSNGTQLGNQASTVVSSSQSSSSTP